MSTDTDTGADPAAAARWAAAADLAAGVVDDRLRRRRTRALVLIAALVVLGWVLGVVLAILLPHTGSGSAGSSASGSRSGAQPGDGRFVVQVVFLVLGLAVGITGFVWARRTGHYVTRWRFVVSPLSPGEKRAVRRQIAGRAPVDESHLDTIVAAAAQSRRAVFGVAPLYAAVLLFAVATAVGTDDVTIRALELAASVLVVVGAVQLAVGHRRAGRFVARYGAAGR